jgi:colanic acid/amylovoran biosynthesis glycosyltransferase
VKLGFVCGLFPFAYREQYFEAEVTSLSEYFTIATFETRATSRINRYPAVPGTPVFLGVMNSRLLALAFREFARSPKGVARMLWFVATAKCSIRGRIVNLALFPKALAFAWTAREMKLEHLHVNWLTTSATIVYVASKLTGIPYSMTAHQHDIFSGNLIVPKVRDAEFVRVISARNCRHLRELLPAELRDKCVVGHLGVRLHDAPAAAAAHPGPTRMLCAARLCTWKGHRYLIDALVAVRSRGLDFVCDFAGEDETRGQIARLVAASGLGSRIRLLGYVPHDDLVRALERGEYDMSVLASTESDGEHEGIPVALMEAMAARLPVVATRSGSVPELVDGTCGILVEQRDAHGLAAAIGRLIEEPALRKQFGEAGHRKVFAEFETRETARRLARLLCASKPWKSTGSPERGQKSLV